MIAAWNPRFAGGDYRSDQLAVGLAPRPNMAGAQDVDAAALKQRLDSSGIHVTPTMQRCGSRVAPPPRLWRLKRSACRELMGRALGTRRDRRPLANDYP